MNSESKADVIVVDNASTDGTVGHLKEYFPRVEVIQNQRNLGFGAANNHALKLALEQGYEFFFLLNQDAYLEPNVIGDLEQSLSQHPEYGILSPIHKNGSGSALDYRFEGYVKKRFASGFHEDYRLRQLKKTVYEVEFVNAAAWFISRNCLVQVGLFHPLFTHYGEDDNYVRRVHAHGLKIGVLSTAIIYHDREEHANNNYRRNPRLRFRRIILQKLLNPKRPKSASMLFYQSMQSLFTMWSSWYFLPDVRFYLWGIATYFKTKKEVNQFEKHQNHTYSVQDRKVSNDV